THRPGEPLVRKGGTTYFFVTDGVEGALARAKATAGEKDIAVMGGASVIRQLMNAGLLDELRLHLAHVLLGKGTRLFDASTAEHVDMLCTHTIESPGATHLTFRPTLIERD